MTLDARRSGPADSVRREGWTTGVDLARLVPKASTQGGSYDQGYNTQRNVLLTVLAAAAAIGLGFLLGRAGGRGEPAASGV